MTGEGVWSDDDDSDSDSSSDSDVADEQRGRALLPGGASGGTGLPTAQGTAAVLASAERLRQALSSAKTRLEALGKEIQRDRSATLQHKKELEALLGTAKSARMDPHVRPLLAGDVMQGEAQNVSSLRQPVDYFFGRRPPMDARGRQLQGQVIDHRAANFNQRQSEALVKEVLVSVKMALINLAKQRCGSDAERFEEEMDRLRLLSDTQWLDEAEKNGICLADPGCAVWQQVGHVMWKFHKKFTAECRIQFLNNDDPRLAETAWMTSHGSPGAIRVCVCVCVCVCIYLSIYLSIYILHMYISM